MGELLVYDAMEPGAKYIVMAKIFFIALLVGAVGMICILAMRQICERIASCRIAQHEAEGRVVGKSICFPRIDKSKPIILVPLSQKEAVRKTGRCELLLYVACNKDNKILHGWVEPHVFDSVDIESDVVVTFSKRQRAKNIFDAIRLRTCPL